MFDDFIDRLKEIAHGRLIPVVLIYAVCFYLLVARIFAIQIVEQQELTTTGSQLAIRTKERKATRGEIYDCNGVLLAYNELSYNVTLEDIGAYPGNDEMNAMILRLIRIIEKEGGSIALNFYITQDRHGKLAFTVRDNQLLQFKKNAYALRSVDELTDEMRRADAEEVYEHLRTGDYMFGISDEYSIEDTLKIMTVRYHLFMNKYTGSSILVAAGISEKTLAAIKENLPDLKGVEIAEETYRVYNDSLYFAHILGYTGLINETELENDETGYYTATDQIGKTGLERAFETYLRGVKGNERVAINATYDVTTVLNTVDSIAGNNLYLSIDSTLQKAVYHILEQNLASVLLSRLTTAEQAGDENTTSSNLMVPINDVYYALIGNNILDVGHFSAADATEREAAVYKKYLEEEDSVLSRLADMLRFDSDVTSKKAGEEMAEYLNYAYDYLVEAGYLLADSFDEEDDVVAGYREDTVSLAELLKTAIASQWVDFRKVGITETYYSTEEIYQMLMDRLFEEIRDDRTLAKMIYKTLVYNYTLSGRELCLLLYDQGLVPEDEELEGRLASGQITPYAFMREKIQKLEITPGQLALDPCSGSVVISDPATGKVKAMVTYPSYDNNYFANQIDAAYYVKIGQDLSYPMINRPTQQRTAPGSTFKPISAAAALESGAVGEYEEIYDGVVFQKTERPATCWSNFSHGDINIREAIEVSCNFFFYECGYRMSTDASGNYVSAIGLEKLNNTAAKFGFAEDVTSGVEVYEYTPDISYTDAIRSAIGQAGYAFTPTQINRYTGAVANGGTLNYLTLVDRITDTFGEGVENTISQNGTEEAPVVDLKKSTWDVIHDGLYLVLNGPRSDYNELFEDLPVTVAGKTGTAQFSTKRGNHALFTSYAPFETPEIAMTVVIPYGYTSTNAAMTAADIYAYYFGESSLEEIMNRKAGERATHGVAD